MSLVAKRGRVFVVLVALFGVLMGMPVCAYAGEPGGPPGGPGGSGGADNVGSANTVATIQTVATMAVVVVGVLALLAVILVVLSLVKKGTQKTGRPGEIASRVGAAVGALLLMIAMTGTSLANASASQVNSYMGTTSTKVISEGDATYFSSEFDSWEAQFENAKRVGVRIQEEGSVLMKNDNRSLPLSEGAKVSLFSRSSVDIVYGGAGSGTIDTSLAPTLKSALEAVGMDVNDTLWDFYGGQTEYVRSLSDVAEVPVSAFSNDVIASYDQYGDAAIVVLARACGEGEDLSAEAAYLEIKDEERALLAHVTEYFDNVIVLINSGNAVALDWLLEYDVDSVLWIGLPGQNGLEGVANLLVGGVTPSGKLADVYAANSFSSAAMQNFGEYYYTNSEIVPSDSEFTATANFTDSTDTKHLIPGSPAYLVQAEGIYVGYKYYETRYEDTVLGQGNASGSAGAYESANGKWNYADEVAYTFGHGLSYTTFEQTLDAFEQEGDQVKLTVTVKNTGNAYGGKDVVEVYAQAPYIAGGVEKASVQLCGFAKTGELAPGDSQTVEITVDLDDVASYDAENEEAYILDAGTYYFAVGSDAHDALNNILAAKGKTVADGMDYDGDAALVGSVELAGEVIDADPASGGKIENRFEQGDLNYYGDYVTYLSRGDWQNTWPKTFENLEATDAMIADLENDYTSKATDITELTYNEDNGLTLVALREAEYDDPRWEQLLNQMSFEEQVEVVKSGASQTAAVASIAFSGTVDEDGPAGLSKRTYYENPKDSGTSTNTNAYGYSASVVIASTWSTDMAYERGVSVGEDGLWTNVVGWWGPACNTHRTPYGGRNFEYYSEDAYLGGMIAASDVAGAQSKGMRSFIKHFAGNEQETHRHGVSTFSTEQAFREIYLKQFEHVVKDGETLSMMESYTRIGCVWAGASALCDGLLRGEWGFVGGVLTDFNVHNDEGWMNVRSGLAHGVNQWLSFGECDLAEYAKDDIGLAVEIRDSCHHVLYAVSRTAAMNGMDENARIEFVNTWWQNSLYMLVAASAVLTVACLVGVVSSVLRKRNKLAVQSEKEER